MKSRRLCSPAALALLVVLVALSGLALGACSSSVERGDRVPVVGAMYPLAWLAERVGGERVAVTDLTPPGVEAHDVALTADQRADLQTAAVVLLINRTGFQPDVEAAADEAQGEVLLVPPGAASQSDSLDPHVWLDPALLSGSVGEIADAMATEDSGNAEAFRQRGDAVGAELDQLWGDFDEGLQECEFRSFVTTHEAFGYLSAAFGLQQIGIEGLTPEAEPSAQRIEAAQEAIRAGQAAPVVFYENTDAGRRIGESVAADLQVEPLPLSTLESAPAEGDYLSVMRENLARLQEGLQCQ